ncbi:hypothetical protein PX554_20225 [Sphingomonas sp. H39-1-10]|uniref:hypothetical protein n=1 Tax=Sphingomonas pollutisoli TaxID=3030829 RepID=UPI0023B9FF11|nr:hypothetical protein [Sphingomonas pollutisoli]MDF0490461.1 hypothetical protein [Sphingomonas pollutisoli]
MPLWLDLLRTPMAAPETPALRRWRLCWLGLCVALAGSILGRALLHVAIGRGASAAVAGLLLAVVLVGLIYWRRKLAADRDWLDRMGQEPDA